MREGSFPLAKSAKVMVRESLFFKVTKRDCDKCKRLGSTGKGRSSPSLKSPERAVTLKATVPTFFGVVIGKVRLVPPSLATVKALGAVAAPVRPKFAKTLWLVSVSI